jgi:GTPase SAR1 family protein
MVQAAPQKINLILLGDGSVGKTSMIKMYAEKKFTESHMATLGLDFVSKSYKPAGSDKDM